MKTLLLMRHAKSDWSQEGQSDHERALNKRGRKAAKLMAEYLTARELVPQFVLLSSSRRTRETYERMLEVFPTAPASLTLEELYLASPDAILNIVRSAPPIAGKLMLLGHNPGIEIFARGLAAKQGFAAPQDTLLRLRTKFPTGAIAVFSYEDLPWSEFELSRAVLQDFAIPAQMLS